MSYRDYIHCSVCDCKLIYDGSDTIRDSFIEEYGEDYKILCPGCLKTAPDLLALLKRCKPWLEEYKFMLVPDRPQELINLLSDIAKAEADR